MIIGTAGHIDHGKTALVRALTGVDTDRLPEERRRGISIELGFALLTLDGGTIASIVDVPGHERFVDTMAAGAAGIDAALLVVAATEGVMPQTREHCAILRALRVPIAVVAVTKIDRVSPDAVANGFVHLRASLAEFGVSSATPLVPVDAHSGSGVSAVRAALAHIVERIAPRDPDDLFRFIVDRSFSVRGTGTVVTGTAWSGTASVGERVRALPDGRAWRIRAVQSHGSTAARATAGARFALALADAAPEDVSRGATLVTDDAWSPSTRLVVRTDAAPTSLSRRLSIQLGGARANARWSASGDGVLRLALDRPLVARRGDRIVIRAGGVADEIAGAVVVDPFPSRGAAIVGGGPVEQLAALARAAGVRGVARATLPVRLGIAPRDVNGVILAAAVRELDDRLVDPEALSQLVEHAVAIVDRSAVDDPFANGVALDELRRALGAPTRVVDAALVAATHSGRLLVRDGRAAPARALAPGAELMLARVLQWVNAAGIAGVTLEEGAAAFGAEAAQVLRHAERRGNLIRIDGVRYCAAAVLAEAVDRLRAAMRSGREFTPGELRGVLGVSRKYLIPLLEYCDGTGVTVRRSGGRVLVDVSSR